MTKNIALFGLSGNPPTGERGHVGIIKSLIATGLFDEIWVIPVYVHIYSSKRNLAPYLDRIEMCRLSMTQHSTSSCQVQVLEIEREVYEWCMTRSGDETYRVGSIDTLRFIVIKYPDVKINLILGADTFQDLVSGRWKEADRYWHCTVLFNRNNKKFCYFSIFENATVHVMPREGSARPITSKPFNQLRWASSAQDRPHSSPDPDPDPDLFNASSTLVRSVKAYPYYPFCSMRNPLLEEYLDPSVVDYMEERGLYMFAPVSIKIARWHAGVMLLTHALFISCMWKSRL